VVGADVGGIRFSVVDGVTGALVPPNDPDALAECLARLYRQPERLKEFGREGLRRANTHFTWPKVARGIAGFYDQVLASVREAA
jgi:glycosyltransferase involved in cell wall biosynthesis